MSGFMGILLMFALLAIIIVGSIYLPYYIMRPFRPVAVVLIIILALGFVQLEPNVARAMVFFGKYKGTLRENGFWWIVNPFYTKKIISEKIVERGIMDPCGGTR